MVSERFDVKEIEIEIKKGNEEGKSQKGWTYGMDAVRIWHKSISKCESWVDKRTHEPTTTTDNQHR